MFNHYFLYRFLAYIYKRMKNQINESEDFFTLFLVFLASSLLATENLCPAPHQQKYFFKNLIVFGIFN
jgi:hypothetical protein